MKYHLQSVDVCAERVLWPVNIINVGIFHVVEIEGMKSEAQSVPGELGDLPGDCTRILIHPEMLVPMERASRRPNSAILWLLLIEFAKGIPSVV